MNRSRAFGLDLESEFPIYGLPRAERSLNGRPTAVTLTSEEALEETWRPAKPDRLADFRDPDGSLVLAIDRDDRLGYRLTSDEWGEYQLSPDGRHIDCAPPQLAWWRRERVLTGRALPLAATLHGLEVFHASTVSFGDAAVAFVGPRQIGKTSVAVHLLLHGASFVTDDLLAMETAGGEIIAHPGAAVIGVRPDEYRLIEPGKLRELGDFVERLGKFFAEVERVERPLPLRIVYFLSRRRTTRELTIEDMDPPDPRLLLASSFFNSIVHSPERLRGQLDLCSRLSQTALLCLVSVPPSVGAKQLAESLAEHARERLGAAVGP
jgi:hypothetical protein